MNQNYSKIDRVLVNMEWLNCIPDCTANFLPPGVSDHSPAILIWNENPKKVSPFRINNKWTTVSSFRATVEKHGTSK